MVCGISNTNMTWQSGDFGAETCAQRINFICPFVSLVFTLSLPVIASSDLLTGRVPSLTPSDKRGGRKVERSESSYALVVYRSSDHGLCFQQEDRTAVNDLVLTRFSRRKLRLSAARKMLTHIACNSFPVSSHLLILITCLRVAYDGRVCLTGGGPKSAAGTDCRLVQTRGVGKEWSSSSSQKTERESPSKDLLYSQIPDS